MARLQKTLSVVVVLLSSLFVLSTSISKDDYHDLFPDYVYDDYSEGPTAPSPFIMVDISPQTEAEYTKFLDDCAKKLAPKCTAERYASIVENKKISSECCVGLINMGFECHIELAKLLWGKPELKPIIDEIVPRSEQAWKDCVLAAEQSPSPSPLA